MALKCAYFRLAGLRVFDPIALRELRTAEARATVLGVTTARESFHSVRFWCDLLRTHRRDAQTPLAAALEQRLVAETEIVYHRWWVDMRYKANPTLPAELERLQEAATWFDLVYPDLYRGRRCFMPVVRRGPSNRHPHHDALVLERVRHLKDEPNLPEFPRIVEETVPLSTSIRVLVLWDEWESVRDVERSEIILEAYDQAPRTRGDAEDLGRFGSDPLRRSAARIVGPVAPQSSCSSLIFR